jgi:hypothetical protein
MALNDPHHSIALEKRYARQPRPKAIEWNGRASLNGRDRLRAALLDRGFKLI